MNAAKRHAIFARLRELNPSPQTELRYTTPFELLIAVILSAQATDKSVNKATIGLFRAANSPSAMLALGVAGVSTHIQSIGLYNSKAKNIIATCGLLLERHGGVVPNDRDALESLPGVGRKTANVVTRTAEGEYVATPAPKYADDEHQELDATPVPRFIVEDDDEPGSSGVRIADR